MGSQGLSLLSPYTDELTSTTHTHTLEHISRWWDIFTDAVAGEGKHAHAHAHSHAHIKRSIFYLSLSVPLSQKVKSSHATTATPVQYNAIQHNSCEKYYLCEAKAVRGHWFNSVVILEAMVCVLELLDSIKLHRFQSFPTPPKFVYGGAEKISQLTDNLMDRKLIKNNFDNFFFFFKANMPTTYWF